MKVDFHLAMCAKVNFENLERIFPEVKKHPFYILAKAQLDEALGEENAIERAAEKATEDQTEKV